MKRNMDSDSIYRLAQHLPRPRRISVDDRTAWVMEDPVQLIILKGHLLVEAELVDICSRLLANPSALEKDKVNFPARLNLVRALIDDGDVPEAIWQALGDLNKIRNKLAHNLEPKDIERELPRFFHRFDEFDDFRQLHIEEALPSRLISCLFFLCGVLSGIGKPVTTQTESDGA
jgi:hypothetical protein